MICEYRFRSAWSYSKETDCDRWESNMKRYALFAATAMMVILPLACRTTPPAPEVQPEPARFSDPDEIVEGDAFLVVADRRMFAAMAFLNAAGYDEEPEGFAMHPVRVKVRQAVKERLANEPRKLKTYEAYYREVIARRIPVFAYKDYVLSLSANYPFRPIQPADRLGYPYTAEPLRRLPEILNEFWTLANLEDLWKQVRTDYITEIHRYNVWKMKQQMAFLWEYLRLERQDPFIIVHIPDLLSRHLGAMGAEYEPYFYCVDNPGANDGRLNMHEYLHTIVNPLVEAHYDEFEAKLNPYYSAVQRVPAVAACGDPATFVYECLVAALNRRISIKFENDPTWTRRKEAQVARDTKDGLILAQPFYDGLAEYERTTLSFDQFLPTLLAHLPEYRR